MRAQRSTAWHQQIPLNSEDSEVWNLGGARSFRKKRLGTAFTQKTHFEVIIKSHLLFSRGQATGAVPQSQEAGAGYRLKGCVSSPEPLDLSNSCSANPSSPPNHSLPGELFTKQENSVRSWCQLIAHIWDVLSQANNQIPTCCSLSQGWAGALCEESPFL